MGVLTGKTIAFLTSQAGIEEAELTEPWKAVTEAGATAVLLAPESGEVQAVRNDDEKAGSYLVDRTIDDADVAEFDALVIPGGTINADTLRTVPAAVELVTEATRRGLLVASVCHGPWALVEADVLEGKVLTSYPSLQTDVRNAGGDWVDEEVHIDDAGGWTLITSRNPDDLPAFNAAIIDQLS